MDNVNKSPAEVLEAGAAVAYIRRKLSTAFHEAAGATPPSVVRVRRAELETLLLMAARQAPARGGEA